MARALVTGAAGFIGSHLCEKLVAAGHTVMGVDDLSTGRQENLAGIINNLKFKFTNLPISDICWLVRQAQFDFVFHLAAKADIVPSIVAPIGYHSTNVTETASLLDACRDSNITKFVYAASSSCYGIPDHDNFPTLETAHIRCEYPYALTKNVGEQYVLHWGRVYKIPVLSLRLFNVYGPRSRTNGTYGAVFGVFLSQLANDKPVTIVGDGTQTRDFTYVSDVCEAFILAASSQYTGQVFNVGSGGTYPINYIADLLGAKERVFIPKRPGEPGITFANIEKAGSLLGYRPSVSIEQGCEVMRKHIVDYKGAPLWTAEAIKRETKDWFQYLGGK